MKQKKKMTSTGFLLLITIVLFFVMYAAGMVIFADKGFAKPQMFLNLFVSNAGLLVISCGLTIVMITGGIDISVGSVTALVCMVMADLMENKGVSAYVAVLAALLIGLAFGIVQGFLVTYMGIQPFIVTLAGMFFGRGMTAIISTDMISIKNEVFLKWANYRFYMPFGSTNKKGKFIPAYIPPTVVIAIIVVLIIAVLLKYFKFGRKLYAIGGNRQSALMMGLDVKKTMFRAVAIRPAGRLMAGHGPGNAAVFAQGHRPAPGPDPERVEIVVQGIHISPALIVPAAGLVHKAGIVQPADGLHGPGIHRLYI